VVIAAAVARRTEWIVCDDGHRPPKDGYRGGVCGCARRRGKVLRFGVDGIGRYLLT